MRQKILVRLQRPLKHPPHLLRRKLENQESKVEYQKIARSKMASPCPSRRSSLQSLFPTRRILISHPIQSLARARHLNASSTKSTRLIETGDDCFVQVGKREHLKSLRLSTHFLVSTAMSSEQHILLSHSVGASIFFSLEAVRSARARPNL